MNLISPLNEILQDDELGILKMKISLITLQHCTKILCNHIGYDYKKLMEEAAKIVAEEIVLSELEGIKLKEEPNGRN